MATAEHIPGSILSNLVDHEKDLLAKLEKARAQAREIVEKAGGQARDHLHSEGAKLDEQVAGMRRAAEGARNAAFEATVNTAADRQAGVRREAEGRVPEAAQQVLALFLPEGAEGSPS